MIQAVRDDIKNIISNQKKSDNPALLFHRLCSGIDEPDNNKSEEKKAVIDKFISYYPPSIADPYAEKIHIYQHAFKEWKHYLKTDPQIIFFRLQTCSPLVIGLGEQNVHEFGITLQHPWSTPVIPGSAIKGVISTYAHNYGGPNWHKGALADKKNGLTPISGKSALSLFGGINEKDDTFAGSVDFFPAWWVPDNAKPFIKDIITLHNKSYYQGDGWPNGTDSPLPNSFVVMQPGESFLFAIKGPKQWTATAADVLKQAAANQGFGAKTRVGYGHFDNKTMEELVAEVPFLDDNALAEKYQNRKDMEVFSSAFRKAAINRTFNTENLRDLFLRYRPTTLFLLDLEKKGAKLSWKNINKIYQRYKSRLNTNRVVPDLITKIRIVKLCDQHSPDNPPAWLETMFHEVKLFQQILETAEPEQNLLQELNPDAHELLLDKKDDQIVSFITNWTLSKPTKEDFLDAIQNNPALKQCEDKEEDIILRKFLCDELNN